MTDDRLCCSICGWSTVKRFSKGGKFYNVESAQRRILSHIEVSHPERWAEIQDMLVSEFEEGKFNETS